MEIIKSSSALNSINFQKINTPNPIIIKSIEEATKNYIWNWTDFLEKYKMVA